MQSIPPKRLSSFKVALNATFGTMQPQDITELFEGGSLSKIYRLSINNKNYIVRLMTLEENLEVRKNQISCHQIAAKLGIAPQCYYADANLGIVIMECIHMQGIQVNAFWLQEIAKMLHLLHSYDDFFPQPHAPLFSYMQELMDSVGSLTTSSYLVDYLKKFSDVMYVLRPHLIKQPCHNDLNKYNILFNVKTYFIDWEAAGLEDPFFDLATLCNEFIGSKEQEQYFLKEYFGQKPTPQQESKLLLMKQVSFCYLALHYFVHAANGGLVLSNELIQQTRTALAPWIQKYNIETQDLSDPKDYLNYGLMQLEISSKQMKTEQFSHAKTILQTNRGCIAGRYEISPETSL